LRPIGWDPAITSLDSFKCRKTLKVGPKTYAYYSLPAAEKHGLAGISRLPFSMKVLLENLLRYEDGKSVTKDGIVALADWLKNRRSADFTRCEYFAMGGARSISANVAARREPRERT
jgi:aconitase A